MALNITQQRFSRYQMSKPLYLNFLTDTGQVISTDEGQKVPVWELSVPLDDDACLGEWAAQFWRSYCPEHEIDELRSGPGLSRGDYLIQLCFPDAKAAPGPSIRAGDFAELLISDYVEHFLGYWVPRGKYADKEVRDESVKGVDIVGFKYLNPDIASPNDEFLAFEAKAQLTDTSYGGKLQEAIDGSHKDYFRSAFTLNAAKKRLLRGDDEKQKVITRFQNIVDRPYVFKSGAAAMLSNIAFDESGLEHSTVAAHENRKNLQLIVVRGSDLMKLTHALYKRAADEA
jgi:hypothetical protein